MSKQNTLNILSQVEDMVGNIMESDDFTDADIQLQKEVKAAIEWTKKASVKKTSDEREGLIAFLKWYMQNAGEFDFGDNDDDIINVYLKQLD